MQRKFPELKSRYDVIGAVILVTGLLCSLCIYLAAEDVPVENVLGSDLDQSKIYLRSLETVGGKANLLAAELARWFGGLWYGKNLAFTIAFLAFVVSFWFFFVDYFSDSGHSDPGSPGMSGKKGHG